MYRKVCWKGIDVLRTKALMVGATLTGLACAATPVVQAEPLIPPSPAETAYLAHLHSVMRPSDPDAYHSDGWLLAEGSRACEMRSIPLIGYGATVIPPIIALSAFTYLCPT